MFRRSAQQLWIFRARRVHAAPINGYEVSELPNEKVFEDYMREYAKDNLVIAVLHSGPLVLPASMIGASEAQRLGINTSNKMLGKSVNQQHVINKQDPGARSLLAGFNLVNLGHPDVVKVATIPGPQCPRLVQLHRVLTYPTTLLYYKGKVVDKVVGARYQEVSIKSLFTLRNDDKEVFSSKDMKIGG